MAQVTNLDIWYPEGYPGPAYDLTKVDMFWPKPEDTSRVLVTFRHNTLKRVEFDRAAFEAALAAVP